MVLVLVKLVFLLCVLEWGSLCMSPLRVILIPYSSLVFLDTISFGFQSQVFGELNSLVQDLGIGVPNVEHISLTS